MSNKICKAEVKNNNNNSVGNAEVDYLTKQVTLR